MVPYALAHDYVLVTNNRRDFLKHYAKRPLHDGLVIVVPMVGRNEQVRLFDLALDCLVSPPDTVNKLIEVFSDGEVRVRPWSSDTKDPSYMRSPDRTP